MSADRHWKIPDLTVPAGPVTLRYELNVLLNKVGPTDPAAAHLVTTYVRVVDQAVTSYRLAHETLAHDEPGTFGKKLVAVGHLENCVTEMKRALRFAEALRRRGEPHAPGPPKAVPVFQTYAVKAITDFRDAIEHLDQHLLDGLVPDGAPMAVRVQANALCVEDHCISLTDLACWLRQLHDFAGALSEWRPPPTP